MLGATAFKPVERHGLEAISWFLYDKNTGAIMGRTCKSWALITIFYIIYYSFLAGFWAICFAVFWNTTIDLKKPRWENKNGNIGNSPGLGVRPSQTWKLMDSGMFVFNHVAKDAKDGIEGYQGWVDRTQEFLDETYWDNSDDCIEYCKNKEGCDQDKICKYLPKKGKIYAQTKKKEDIHPNFKMLDNEGKPVAIDDKKNDKTFDEVSMRTEQFYHFDRSSLGDCTKENGFGFAAGKPCILLKLNKIYGVEHEYFNNVTEAEKILEEKLPTELAAHINTKVYTDHVWVDCHGENPMDQENLGKVNYFPASRGFPSVYYPYKNAPGYQTPLVAVQFEKLEPGLLYHIECRAYAGNIGYDRNDRIGKAHFEILVHDKKSVECVYGGEKCGEESMIDGQA